MKKIILYAAWIQAIIATLGSLYLSTFLHWVPCTLCWFQRIFMYPLVFILAVAILLDIEKIEYIVLPLTFTGMAISIYHNLLMYRIIPEKFAVCAATASCTIPYHFWYGFLTVPLLSLIAFIVITICMFIYKKKGASI